MAETQPVRSVFFKLRGAFSLVILSLLIFHHELVSPSLWALGTAYLVSNLIIVVLPASWFEDPRLVYAVFFLDLGGLSIVLYFVSGFRTESLLILYLTVLMATLGETVAKSVGIAIASSALYFWLRLTRGEELLGGADALLRVPLFFITAILCGYLAQEVRRHKQKISHLHEIQGDLEARIESTFKDLSRSEDLRYAAQELAMRFRDLVQDLKAIVWEMDVPSFRITFVSQQAERVLGFPVEDWLSSADFWKDHIFAEDRDRVIGQWQTAVAENKDYDIEYRALAAENRVVWLRDIIRVVRDPSGKARQLRGVIVDITEKKQLEEEFRQAQKMEAVGRLAGGVAHDFNNLLTIITGYTQLLLESLAPGDPHREFVGQIQSAGERAAALTRRLLAFSRRQALVLEVLDLNAIVANTEKMLRRLIGEDIELVTLLPAGLSPVKVDASQIEQVIINLAVNSRDAMPQGGKLLIETSDIYLDQAYAQIHAAVKPGHYVMLAVSDTGTGMDTRTMAHIFEPFFTTKEKGKGTGLGLATVYGIVKQCEGYIWVYSEPGHGTSFKVYLPRAEEIKEAAHSVEVHAATPHGSETVLLVEDEDGVRSLVRGILEAGGYKVLDSNRPLKAWATCQQFDGPIHLLLTDVVMPQMNGPDLAEKLKVLRPNTKVLYMSGYTDGAILYHGVLQPGTPFLQKPFTPDVLARKVREVLDASVI
ncbi:MAG TPA: ATP-binding protein [Terriglobia bacterium]|nr:ATP-binding protein [Terriglobia bacterium]